MDFTANALMTNGITISLGLALVGLVVAFVLIRMVVSKSAGTDLMKKVAGAIQDGAKAYLRRQVVTISVSSGILAVILFLLAQAGKVHTATPIGFLVGAACSLIAGYIGMRIAVMANVRTTQAASESEHKALRVAFNGGAVTGLLVVGLALLSVGIFYKVMLAGGAEPKALVDSLIGLALGASLISVFARLGGGIYTKAADVGADLVGKIEQGLDEDDPRNPATIADNVGDNVGDCAGMAADVFETYAVSLIGALLLATLQTDAGVGREAALMFPFLLGGIAIIGSVLGVIWVNLRKGPAARLLMEGVFIASVFSAVAYWPVTNSLFEEGLTAGGETYSAASLFGCALVGIVMTFAIVLITNYYTATQYRPVKKIARASQTGHATNIIAGLGVGNMATGLPVALICASIWTSHALGGLYGVSVAVMAMLALAGIIVSLDAFGPITDNAGGIAVMADLPPIVRDRTDALDAVGNTMKAVTKGYAIASAGVAALVLFGSYFLELEAHLLHKGVLAAGEHVAFSLKDPVVIIGMFIGGLLPFIFSALSMDAVGRAAGAVVAEVRRQISERPGIMEGKDEPEYARCVDIVTRSALREMIIPALLPVIMVVVVASIPGLGYVALGGVLVGTIVTGLFVGLSMTAAGGAWDNAKKMIEDGAFGGKGSEAHAAAITGDTVGDPYKDTSGPAINPMIKVTNIVAIMAIAIFF